MVSEVIDTLILNCTLAMAAEGILQVTIPIQ